MVKERLYNYVENDGQPYPSNPGLFTSTAFGVRHLCPQSSILSRAEWSIPYAKVDQEIDEAEVMIISEIA